MKAHTKKFINEHVIDWCKKFKQICYECPMCNLLTCGIATSYHAQIHGEQTIHYNPLPKENRQ